jgi:hypothetical protein
MTRHEWFLGYDESTLEKLIDYGFRNQHGRTSERQNDNDHAVAAECSSIRFRHDRPLACIVWLCCLADRVSNLSKVFRKSLQCDIGIQ